MEKTENIETKVNIAVQINGKTRGVLEIEKDIEKEKVIIMVKNNIRLNKYLKNEKILKEIYVSNKIINFVL